MKLPPGVVVRRDEERGQGANAVKLRKPSGCTNLLILA